MPKQGKQPAHATPAPSLATVICPAPPPRELLLLEAALVALRSQASSLLGDFSESHPGLTKRD